MPWRSKRLDLHHSLLKSLSWRSEVQGRLNLLPRQFRLTDIYRFVPALHQRFPENSHIEDRIRETLQELVADGQLRRLERGTYENLSSGAADIQETLPIPKGEHLDRDRLSRLLGQAGSAALDRGMFSPDKGPFRNHIFLFHDERRNPYGDQVTEGRIHYVGQGQTGDQKLNSYNRYLADHLEMGLHAQFFTQPKDRPGKIRYEGEVVLESFERIYRPDEDRSVLEFRLVPFPSNLGSPLNEFGHVYDEILESESDPIIAMRPRVPFLAAKVIREKAFQEQIRFYYGRRCAACGKAYERGNLLDVQAAHIVGVAEGGQDDRRNGIGLCARHHWAFDNAFFTIEDDFSIHWLGPVSDPHGELQTGMALQVPQAPFPRPHPLYLRHHRVRSLRLSRTRE